MMMRVLDLSLPYDDRIQGFSSAVARRLPDDGWNAQSLSIYSHAGTHVDAPYHFGVSDVRIDQIPVEQFICTAWVVDAESVAPHGVVLTEHLKEIEEKFSPGEGLLIRTNWYKKVGLPEYRNALPRISEGLARWCADHKVSILGVEPPSVADVHNLEEVTLIHQILLGGDVIIAEGLANLDAIRSNKVLFFALPLKIKDGDGAPARAFCVEL